MNKPKTREMNTEEKAASVILDYGVRYTIRAPLLLRLFGKKNMRLTIKALRARQLFEISKNYLAMGIDPEEIDESVHTILKENTSEICRVIAGCAITSRFYRRIFRGVLGRIINDCMSWDEILEMFLFVHNYSGLESFKLTIRLMATMRMMMTQPNLSPEDQGSQQSQD